MKSRIRPVLAALVLTAALTPAFAEMGSTITKGSTAVLVSRYGNPGIDSGTGDYDPIKWAPASGIMVFLSSSDSNVGALRVSIQYVQNGRILKLTKLVSYSLSESKYSIITFPIGMNLVQKLTVETLRADPIEEFTDAALTTNIIP